MGLTQSRRALREALRPLLPQRVGERMGHAIAAADDLTMRRAKVSRFLRRRMEEPNRAEVGS